MYVQKNLNVRNHENLNYFTLDNLSSKFVARHFYWVVIKKKKNILGQQFGEEKKWSNPFPAIL